ncbi:MAG: hypothetical protein PHG65_09545 [Kiritimatiellae bacterium]|nr:hypothetical protein [Kiritimatiellia bacterium]
MGWFAGNEPIEMTREGVYTGPRLREDANGWQVLWEDGSLLQHISKADVNVLLKPLEEVIRARRHVLPKEEQDPMDFVREGSSQRGMLSTRYALYGGTSFISAFRFLRCKPGRKDNLHEDLQAFVVRSLAVVRGFKERAGERLLYIAIPEATEVNMDLVRSHPDYQAMLNVLHLNEEDLSIAAYLRKWFMDLLQREQVPCVDPIHDMKRDPRTAMFRMEDLHPTMKGNAAIAEAIARELDAFNPQEKKQKGKASKGGQSECPET